MRYRKARFSPAELGPPVEDDECRVVEIEDVGEQGDGIARAERGYVIIVPDTEPGERVVIEIRCVSACCLVHRRLGSGDRVLGLLCLQNCIQVRYHHVVLVLNRVAVQRGWSHGVHHRLHKGSRD